MLLRSVSLRSTVGDQDIRGWCSCHDKSYKLDHPSTAEASSNRFISNSERSSLLVPVVARSARDSPMTLANLNPCPEHGDATTTSGDPGRVSITKCSSGVLVNR